MCPDCTLPKVVQIVHGIQEVFSSDIEDCHSNERDGADDGGNPGRFLVAPREQRILWEKVYRFQKHRGDVSALHGRVSLIRVITDDNLQLAQYRPPSAAPFV